MQPTSIAQGNPEFDLFVHTNSHETLVSALETVLGKVTRDVDSVGDWIYCHCDAAIILIIPSEDGFLSVWIRSVHPHWANDVEFGHFISRTMGVIVRCDPGACYPEIHPFTNVFLEIADGKETLVEWG